MPITVEISFVDGGGYDMGEPDEILDDLADLEARGLKGKALIDALLTDDWGPPPSVVRIHGRTAAGKAVDLRIAYD